MSHTTDQPLQQALAQLAQAQTTAAPVLTDLASAVQDLAQLIRESQRALPAQVETNSQLKQDLLREAEDLQAQIAAAQQRLQQPVLRLLVLGDVKRGKSTVLNALLGATVLPSAAHPCTAVITVLRYGPSAQVILEFNHGRSPETLAIEDFHRHYTLSSANNTAFDNVAQAVIEYPSPLLQTGVEIVDSPGLNDTEQLNARSLTYLSTCHAVLFVMRAVQPCTLTEQRYIHTHLTGKGITPFFLLNGWDEIQASLLDPQDADALAGAEARLRQVFTASLQDYIAAEPDFDPTTQVLPLSALRSLRHHLQGTPPDAGFVQLATVLTEFVSTQRTQAQLRPLSALSQQVRISTQQWIDTYQQQRSQALDRLKQSVLAVAAPFEALADQKEQLEAQIQQQTRPIAVQLADSLKHHLSQAERSFETAFVRYRPPLQLTDQLTPTARQTYQQHLETAFQRYLTDQLEQWRAIALPQLRHTLATLAETGHRTVAHQMLDDIQLPPPATVSDGDWSVELVDWASDLFAAPDTIATAAQQRLKQRLAPLGLTLWTAAYRAVAVHLQTYTKTVTNRIETQLGQQQRQLQQQLDQHRDLKQQHNQTHQQLEQLSSAIAQHCTQIDAL